MYKGKFYEELKKRYFMVELDYTINGTDVIKEYENYAKENEEQPTDKGLAQYLNEAMHYACTLSETISEEQAETAYNNAVSVPAVEWFFNGNFDLEVDSDCFEVLYKSAKVESCKTRLYMYAVDGDLFYCDGFLFSDNSGAYMIEDMTAFELNDGKHHTLEIIRIN